MRVTRLSHDRAAFAAWWREIGRGSRIATGFLLLLLPAGALFAIAVMGPRLVREGRLLWFGARADGVIRASHIDQVGAFKGGAPKYRLRLTYRFQTPDGRSFTGTTERNDVRDPPDFGAGAPMGVYYDPAHPENSVAEHNLRTDVYALVLFLPFLCVVCIGLPLWFAMALRVGRADGCATR